MEENSETNCEQNYDAVNDYGVQGANPETARAENPHEERDDFLPDCDETKKPYIGQRFDTIDDVVQFYKQYASLGGFDVRCSTIRKNRDGEVEVKYLLCSREGHTVSETNGSKTASEDITPNTNTRRRVSNWVGCKARCGIKRRKDGYYVVTILQEQHNHPLCSELARPFLKINRTLDIGHQEFIAACAKANIGTSKAFDLYKELTSGFDQIGATRVDFRNCRRDVNAQLHEADAQAVIDKYRQKQILFPSYTFEYDVDEENRLRRLFWADPIAKENYKHFGDMVSFDATYRTNSMWHIMTKLGEKAGAKLAKDETFRKKVNAVVWNESLGREDFETNWHAVMVEYGLGNNSWFTQLFDGRKNWIDVYFSDVFIGGLMRTTSRSEGENSIFGACINKGGTLLEFFTQFESVIETQRHKQSQLIAKSEASFPPTKTPLMIEKHATSIYTITMFYDVQTEIHEGCFSCKITNKDHEGDKYVYTIKEEQTRNFTVKYERANNEVECSCGKFTKLGILCRHAFVVLKDEDAERIPPKYIVPRWTKNARAHNTSSVGTDQSATCNKEADGVKLAAQLWKEFYNYMALSKGDMPEMKEMLNFMLEHKGKLLKSKGKTQNKSNNSQLLETFYGTPASTTITVKPPQISKNKGSGKRLKSAREKAIEKKKKDGRKCHYCDEQPARHDFRNCPLNPNKKKKQNKKLKA
ncbi:protein FAR1-RELATED SEQUENCE 5-like [Ipomoea triloba]|uniref:protein FAR1-RELATED SEQUENCE 5-like n=1 Tax=Ipomoea triloba TaxID=35885 RepID=UPI00125E2C83|nr:protein FAR1-RELATED SEQUENCE 5-like [Ipomoea triloba]